MPIKDPEARKAYHKEYMKKYLQDPENRAKHRQRLKRNKDANTLINRERIRELKELNPCTDCGNTYAPECMDFDHLPQFEKKANIALMVASGSTWKLISQELAKCELVCANCHRVRTTQRIQKNLPDNYLV